jgi:hypothetical protein
MSAIIRWLSKPLTRAHAVGVILGLFLSAAVGPFLIRLLLP